MRRYLAVFSALMLGIVAALSALAALGALESAGRDSAEADAALARTLASVRSRWESSADVEERASLELVAKDLDALRGRLSGGAYAGRDRSRGLLAFIAAASLAALAATAGLWLFTWRRLAKPLADLSRAMRLDWESPDFPRLEASGPAEVRALHESFADLRSRLLDYRGRVARAERESIGRFLVHEIRNALTPLPMALKLARDAIASSAGGASPTGDGEAKRALAALSLAAAQVAETEALLESFRATYRFPEPRLAPVDLAELVRRLPEVRDPRVSIALPETGPLIRADHNLLARALGNLVKNALEACDAAAEAASEEHAAEAEGGEGRARGVRIGLGKDREGISLVVEDEGVGMDAELLSRIFGEWVTTKRKGMGLGLAFAKRVAEAHGFGLKAESEPGRGSSFRLIIGPEGGGEGHG